VRKIWKTTTAKKKLTLPTRTFAKNPNPDFEDSNADLKHNLILQNTQRFLHKVLANGSR
jgi:hypothetical protein